MLTDSPAQLSSETIRRALDEFKLAARDEQVLQMQEYIRILLRWNQKLNLTAIVDPMEILYRHFCESMFAAPAVPIKEGRLADVGAGGGFPGVPLKIIRPDLHVFLIESNLKKATFLAEVIRALGLTNVKVIVRRYEELAEEVAPIDYVCSRALGEFSQLLDWAQLKTLGVKKAVLWIGARDLPEIQKLAAWEWQDPILVPHSLKRLLLVGHRKA